MDHILLDFLSAHRVYTCGHILSYPRPLCTELCLFSESEHFDRPNRQQIIWFVLAGLSAPEPHRSVIRVTTRGCQGPYGKSYSAVLLRHRPFVRLALRAV